MSFGGSIGTAAGAASSNPGLALDSNALASLRASADRDPEGTVRQAATQFEALFMQELLKSMRAAVPQSGLFDGPGTSHYTSMLDSQLTQAMAGRPGGLADVIARQMSRHLGGGDAAGGPGVAEGTDPAMPAGMAALPPNRTLEDVDRAHAAAASADRPLDPVQAAFVETMWPHAKAAERLTGVPAAYVVGQAALESGWGRRDIRDADGNPSHNLFGIKATGGWQGRTVATLTTEYVDGQPRKMVEQFRRYESYAEAFADWSRLMTRSSRYAAVLKADTATGFARGLEAAGYATDPGYGDKLARTIRQAETVAHRTQRSGVQP